MTLIELKRMIFKAPIMVLLVFIVPAFVLTAFITPVKNVEQANSANTDLHEIHSLFWDEIDYVQELSTRYTTFQDTVLPFIGYDVPSIDDYYETVLDAFDSFNSSFINFYNLTYEYLFANSTRVQIKQIDLDKLEKAIDAIAVYIEFNYNDYTVDAEGLKAKRIGIYFAWEDSGGKNISGILAGIKPIELTPDQRSDLKEMYNKVQSAYGDYSDVGYMYLDMQYRKAAGLSYSEDELKILGVLVDGRHALDDFARPYSFNNVAHKSMGTSPYDFIFNAFEILAIPLILFGVLAAAFCIFDDIKKNTVITPLIAPQSRTRVILAKLSAIAIIIALIMILYFILFYSVAIVVAGTVAPPTIITVFGGTVIKISPLILLLIYILSLFFKVLFFAAVAAFISINANSIRSLVTKVILLATLIIMLNVTFTVLLPVGFYQFCPFLALDFAGYFGIGLMLSKFTSSVGVWFALPFMLIILLFVVAGTVKRFNKKDF